MVTQCPRLLHPPTKWERGISAKKKKNGERGNWGRKNLAALAKMIRKYLSINLAPFFSTPLFQQPIPPNSCGLSGEARWAWLALRVRVVKDRHRASSHGSGVSGSSEPGRCQPGLGDLGGLLRGTPRRSTIGISKLRKMIITSGSTAKKWNPAEEVDLEGGSGEAAGRLQVPPPFVLGTAGA